MTEVTAIAAAPEQPVRAVGDPTWDGAPRRIRFQWGRRRSDGLQVVGGRGWSPVSGFRGTLGG